jgi:hypothetical protein
MSDITLVLDAINRGDGQAADKLLPLVYHELRNLATARMFQDASIGQRLLPAGFSVSDFE